MTTQNDSIFCSFIKLEKEKYRCIKCGNEIVIQDSIDDAPLLFCFSPLSNFDASAIRDSATNTNLCSINEIQARHDTCISCEFFKENVCEKCGCLLSRSQTYMNKLAQVNEACPIGKW